MIRRRGIGGLGGLGSRGSLVMSWKFSTTFLVALTEMLGMTLTMRPQLRWSTRVHKVRFSVELLSAGEVEPGLVAHHWLVRGTNTGTGEDGSEPNKLDVYVTLISFLQWLTLQGMATLFTSFPLKRAMSGTSPNVPSATANPEQSLFFWRLNGYEPYLSVGVFRRKRLFVLQYAKTPSFADRLSSQSL
jgi:hypothetical protein